MINFTINDMMNLFDTKYYSYIATFLIVLCIVIALYNKIKFKCLEKACEQIATVESMNNLTGKEKFALVVYWINKDLPLIFTNNLVKAVIEKFVQYAYDNSVIYMKNYIKRKTGYDVSALIAELENSNKNNTSDNENTTNNKE